MKSGEFLKKCRIKLGLSLRALSGASGVSHTQIADLENGVNFGTYEKIDKILDALKLTSEEKELYYRMRDLEKTPVSVKEELEKLQRQVNYYKNMKLDSNAEIEFKRKIIPIYSNICAGNGGCEADIISHITVPVDGIFTGDVFAVRVDGDSMEHTIEDKSIVFIKKDVEVPNNRIGAFILNNESYLKRLCKMGDSIFLRSDNRDYPDIHVQPNDDFIVVGRYIGTIMNTDE
ncbi:LexA repressor [Fusobacterium sp. DD29]|uniref:helix-turn-helix domain-containing protein n=1 Tax=unclassified Fusobacterium TaxID=2648384 RepID=UPI001B8B3C00|nr:MULTISPECIES: XRE family transcriptional regulator [unclassified Fusobacterium]MBR8749423.1 LexA repressor [Fusobacterium sp. DD29]MBR8761687.1 LexA repressor [Fusobacterium sp. DD25]MBR8767727.1 LexA repressor [Fusobacterium sp. DD43]MBR8771725.1 LexA repressor [Fusobacterium sp. DD40]MBR8776003.1 LexA repressor [Fusobacterium sp. DD17]